MKGKKNLMQNSDVSESSAEWIHDPIFVEDSRVRGTDPGFSTLMSLNSFSVRKTKGKLLKAALGFQLPTGAVTTAILCLFHGRWRQGKRCANCDVLCNKCPAWVTNISPDVDTDILLPWMHSRAGRNLIRSMGCSVSPSCFSPSAAPSPSLSYPSLQSLRDNERNRSSRNHKL